MYEKTTMYLAYWNKNTVLHLEQKKKKKRNFQLAYRFI